MGGDLVGRGVSLEESIDAAWRRYRTHVADVLAGPEAAHGYLVALDPMDDETGVTGHHLSIEVDCGGLHLCVSANDIVPVEKRVSREALARLRGLGFASPTRVRGDYPLNRYYRLDVPGDRVDEAASITVRVLREVFGALDPHLLCADPEASPAPTDIVDIIHHVDTVECVARPHEHPSLEELDLDESFPVTTADELKLLVWASLAKALGCDGFHEDDDGDFVVEVGQGHLYITVDQTSPRVLIWTHLDSGGRHGGAVSRLSVALNRTRPFLRAYRDDNGGLALCADIFGAPFLPRSFLNTLRLLHSEAEALAPLVHHLTS